MRAPFEGKIRGANVPIERQSKRAIITAGSWDWFIDFFDPGPEIGICTECNKPIYQKQGYVNYGHGKRHVGRCPKNWMVTPESE